MFNVYIINQRYLYDELSKSCVFPPAIKGRQITILVDMQGDQVPIVRTTTRYENPAQVFRQIHYNLIKLIQQTSQISNLKFNNAMIEMHNKRYYTMGWHSDQMLDLELDSYICLFSCYKSPPKCKRQLNIKNKSTQESYSVILDDNSIVLFSVDTNSKHLHQIVLDNTTADNDWLGITFRLSKTLVIIINEKAYFSSGQELRIATEHERMEFYKFKSQENKECKYPDINYTISPSDLMMPKK